MGLLYVIFGVGMGVFLSVGLNIGATVGNEVSGIGTTVPIGNPIPIGKILALLVVPMGALVGLIITTPVYLLFVNDKNVGVLEYLLAVGMDQRDVFMGYMKASIMLSLVAMIPVVLINTAFNAAGLTLTLLGGTLALVTGVSDVALVTVLMTSFSSMQRRPTGMNSPAGITLGVVFLIPDFLLLSVLGPSIVWVEGAVAVGLLVAVVVLLLSLGKLIKREKLLP
jgi:hypothetical protein